MNIFKKLKLFICKLFKRKTPIYYMNGSETLPSAYTTEEELIKIDDTIDNLNYSLYINDYGRLYVSFLVKTTKVDYNEVMEV